MTLGLWDISRSFDEKSFEIKVVPSELVIEKGLQNTPLSSLVEVEYKFKDYPQLRSKYLTINEGIRFGKIVEEMDALAGDCCYKYMLQNDIEQMESGVFPFYLVTVSVDRIEFANRIDS